MRFKVFLILLLHFLSLRCQEITLTGIVTDTENNTPIAGVMISLQNSNGVTYKNTTTTQEGYFKLSVSKELLSNSKLYASCIGYQTESISLTDRLNYNFSLKSKAFTIKEVYVKSSKITHKNDTTSYLVSSFATKKDRTIGEVLRNMPGIEVNKDGKIAYNGKAIDNFFIEGVDLFDGQYNIATRNISHEIISRVDVIENHQTAKVLRDSKNIGGTILNLSLKNKVKGKWTGKFRQADGLPKLWESEFFGANLTAKRQHAITIKSNNSGKDILTENKSLTLEEYLEKSNRNILQPLMSISQPIPYMLSEDRVRNGRTHLLNFGSIKPISNSTILRTKLYFTDYRNKIRQTENVSYFMTDTALIRSTKETNILNDKELGASILLKTDGEKYFFSNELKYSSQWQRSRNIVKGDYNNNSDIHSDIHHFENKLRWVKPWNKNYLQVISTNEFTIMPEKIDLLYKFQKEQHINRQLFFSSNKLNYTCNIARIAVALEAETQISTLAAKSKYFQSENDSTHNANFNYNYFAEILKAIFTYKYHGKHIELQLPYSIYHYIHADKNNKIYCAPKLKIEWQFNAKWKSRATMTLGTKEPMVNTFFPITVMTDYKTLHTRPSFIQSNENQSASLALFYTDYQHMLFANLSVGYYLNNNKLQMIKQINREQVLYSWIKGDNKIKMKILMGNISKQIDAIHGSVNVKWNITNSEAAILQNSTSIPYNTISLLTSLEINASPYSWWDINYSLDYNKNTLKLFKSTSTSKIFKMNLTSSFYPIESLELSTKIEYNKYQSNHNKALNTLLCDMNIIYKYKKIDFTLSFSNLFNQKFYSNTSFNDISYLEQCISLRKRNVLLGATFYF